MLLHVVRLAWSLLRDERGAETLEWILVGGLITGVGVTIYNAGLWAPLSVAITGIGSTINAAVVAAAG